MKRILIAAVMMGLAGGAYAADFGDLGGVKATGLKALAAAEGLAVPESAIESQLVANSTLHYLTPGNIADFFAEVSRKIMDTDKMYPEATLLKNHFFNGIHAPGIKTRTPNYYGEWGGERYDFYLNASSDNIYGNWGDQRSDFYVRGNTENIYGTIAGIKFDIYVRQNSGNIYGTLPCGRTDFYYRVNTRNIYGTLCGNAFDVYFASEAEVIPNVRAMYQQEITRHLPGVLDFQVKSFIDRRIVFQ